jgi:hypothetical protein
MAANIKYKDASLVYSINQETVMSTAKENKNLLTEFLEQIWNAGDI